MAKAEKDFKELADLFSKRKVITNDNKTKKKAKDRRKENI